MQTTTQISFFGILELMGHQKIAGKITEQAIAGTNMLRVDVPETGSLPAYTRYFGGASVYSMSPCTEDVMRAFIKRLKPEPIYAWEVAEMIKEDRLKLAGGTGDYIPSKACCKDCGTTINEFNSSDIGRESGYCVDCFAF